MNDLNLVEFQFNNAEFSSIADYAKNKSRVQSILNQIDTQDAQKTSALLAIIQPALTQLKAVQKQIQKQNELIDKLPLVARWKVKLNHFFVWIKNSYYQSPKLQDLIDKTNSNAEKCKIQPDVNKQMEKETRKISQTSSAKIIEKKIKAQTQPNPNLKAFKHQIDLLEKQLNAGDQKINKKLILNSYTQFLEIAKQFGITPNHPSIQRLQRILNAAYVNHIIDNMEKQSLSFQFISTFLEKLGFQVSSDLQVKQTELLKEWHSKDLNQDPCKLIKQMEHEFLGMFTKQLTVSQMDALQPMINKLKQFERRAQRLMHEIEEEKHKEIEKLILSALPVPGKTHMLDKREQVLQKWRQHTMPSILFDQSLKAMNILQIQANLQRPGYLIKPTSRLNIKINSILEPTKFRQFYMEQVTLFVSKMKNQTEKNSPPPTWFERNAQARRFYFSQIQWGEQQIFSTGVCTAINYRWIRYLIEHPAQAIKSLQDLGYRDPNELNLIQQLGNSRAYQASHSKSIEIDLSEVLPQDRKNQATNALENKLAFSKLKGWISPSILKRDKLKVRIIGDPQLSIAKSVDYLVQEHADTLQPYKGGGIFDIAAYQTVQNSNGETSYIDNAHVMGMQIDPARNIYRFWDVNSGFYQYETLDEMKREFQGYMQEFYQGQYNLFYAAQYTSLDS